MMGKVLKFVMKPHNIVLITVLISFMAWSLPVGNMRRGFEIKETLTSQAFLIIFLWYFIIYVLTWAAYFFGTRLKKSEKLDSVSDDSYYRIITVLSALGVMYVYLTILKNNPEVFISVFQNNANALKETLYNNYDTGLHSLRYISILGGAFGIYRIITIKRIRAIDLLNIMLLLMTALISSRLSIIVSILVLLGMLAHRNHKISFKAVIILAIALFTVLTLANYFRNGNFYKEKYNINNPILMNVSEMVTYLGAPFQTSVSIANNVDRIHFNGDKNDLMFYFVPTYFHGIFNINSSPSNDYRQYVNIEKSLTTNSAFTHLYSSLGITSFSFIVIIVTSFAFVAGAFSNYKSLIFTVHYLISYCFAELWRMYMFNTGIIHTLIFAVFFVLFFKVYIKPPMGSRHLNVNH